jgi:hypothetical protein
VRSSPVGEPVEGLSVELSGEPFNVGAREVLTERTGAGGFASFGPVRPGRYRVEISDRPRLSHHRYIVLYPDGRGLDPIIWPDSPTIPAPVFFAVDMPGDVRDRVPYLVCRLQPDVDDLQELGGVWQRWPTHVLLTPEGRAWVFSADDFEKVWENLPDDRVRVNQNALHLRDQLPMNSAPEYRLESVSVLLPVANADEPEVFSQFGWSDAQRLQNTDPRSGRYVPGPREPEPISEQVYRAEPDQENVWRIEMPDWLIEALEIELAAEDETSEPEA